MIEIWSKSRFFNSHIPSETAILEQIISTLHGMQQFKATIQTYSKNSASKSANALDYYSFFRGKKSTYRQSMQRNKENLKKNIKELEFDLPEKRTIRAVWESSPWVSGGERFEFEYFGKNKKFGRKLNLKDGKLLFNLLKAKIKTYSK